MFTSPFENKTPNLLSEDSRFVFISDLFASDYVGGAELTSQSLIDACPEKIDCIRSKDVTIELLEQGHDKYWIFGNTSALNKELIPTIVSNMEYSVLEYDYKFCKYRSIEKHKEAETVDCNCHEDMHGKLISAFYYGAKSLWWMSEAQQNIYFERFPFLAERQNVVLSSVFDEVFFRNLTVLREAAKNKERKGWVVLGSTSWIKGADDAEQWCKDNNKEYEVVWNIPYEDVLEKLSTAEGFVYLPKGGDTCPRMVIEAKLLGCKLELNEHVQHSKEIWFDTEDMFDTEAYLYAARNRFWTSIRATREFVPTISGYTTTKDCISQKYPFRQSIESMLGFADEVVVVDGGSTDGTWEALVEWSSTEDRLEVFQVKRDWNSPRHAVYDGLQKAEARERCSGEYVWQMDSDEIVHEDDYNKIKELCKNFPSEIDLIALPVVEYWGGPEKVRADINPWKWRLSRNKENITHGIPGQLRKTDENGEMFASQGTDGCDYIDKNTHEVIPFASFMTNETNILRQRAILEKGETIEAYQKWFNLVVDQLPGVHHYSWFDLPRKISTYKNYWSRHWQSLYNIEQEDIPENNMFFDKAWKDVTEKDIEDLSVALKEKMGGWIFHSRVDFDQATPHISITKNQPALMISDE